MGCVQSKSSMYSPPQSPEKLKQENRYVKGENRGRPIGQREAGKMSRQELEKNGREKLVEGEGLKNDVGNVSQRFSLKKAVGDELVDGWPKWFVDNFPSEVLAGLVPKSVDSYNKLANSNVYKARDRDTGKIVALKKVRFDTSEPESVKFMAREIMMLQKLDHLNVIKLEGVATSRMQYSLYLVFDFMQSNLTRIVSRPGERLTEPQVKCCMQQLLSGLQHCHERESPDFGLANFFIPKPKQPLTSGVVTLWYRAPELLLGFPDYGVGFDLSNVGCLLAEMFIRRPIMPGRTEFEQLHRIFKLCGSPPEDYWKIMRLPTSFRPPQHYKPTYRGTAASALQSHFFSSSPLPCQLPDLPVIYKEEDEPAQISDRKRYKLMKVYLFVLPSIS
uniref:Protein kinase domain-containing protein n=1 Tax=Populus trichocarpa TaxID=3694 RepID=A0A2K2ADS0_POPTR